MAAPVRRGKTAVTVVRQACSATAVTGAQAVSAWPGTMASRATTATAATAQRAAPGVRADAAELAARCSATAAAAELGALAGQEATAVTELMAPRAPTP